jgi:hypothetical protein
MEDLVRIFNMLFPLINVDQEHANYYSGPEFIEVVQQFDPGHLDYNQYMTMLEREGLPTSRRRYFLKILEDATPTNQYNIINSILESIEGDNAEAVAEIRNFISEGNNVPTAEIADDVWNADRLRRHLEEIDTAIRNQEYERSVTLSYTCLEGFYRAFANHNMSDNAEITEITDLARAIRNYLNQSEENFPEEVTRMICHIAYTINRTRNGFSESHFGEDAQPNLAGFMRDLVNSQIRMLLKYL